MKCKLGKRIVRGKLGITQLVSQIRHSARPSAVEWLNKETTVDQLRYQWYTHLKLLGIQRALLDDLRKRNKNEIYSR